MRINSEFRIWVNMLSTIALVPLSQLSEALKVVTDFVVITKCDRTPILKYFMKTWINGKYNPDRVISNETET